MRGGLASDTLRASESQAPVIPPKLQTFQSNTSEQSSPATKRGSFTGSVNSDRSSMDGAGSGKVRWVDAMLLIKKSKGQSPVVDAVYPKKVRPVMINYMYIYRVRVNYSAVICPLVLSLYYTLCSSSCPRVWLMISLH